MRLITVIMETIGAMDIKPYNQRKDNFIIILKKIFCWNENFNHQYGMRSQTH